MPYMLAPGARLEVGPGGKMYESMGDCACRPRPVGLGALDKGGNVIGGLKTVTLQTRAYDAAILASKLPPATSASASPGFFSGSMVPMVVVGAAGLGVAAFFLLRKKRRR